MSASLPKGWGNLEFGIFCTEHRRRAKSSDVPIFSVSKDYGLIAQSELFNRRIASADTSNYKTLRRGEYAYDPMLLWTGSIGCLWRSDEAMISPAYTTFGVNNKTVLPKFFDTLIKMPRMIERYRSISHGTNVRRKKAHFDDFAALVVAIPPLAEQRAIAEVLGAVEEAIAKTEALIGAISGALNLTLDWVLGTSKTAYAPVINLGDIIESTKYGTSAKCDDDSSGFPVLRIPNVLSGGIDQTDLKYANLPANEAAKFALRDGDLLAVRTNGNPEYVGRMALIGVLPKETLYASYIIRIRIDPKKALPEYVWLCSETYPLRDSLTSAATTSAGNFNINSDGLRSAKIPLPSLAEQRRIVDAAETLRIRRQQEITYLDQLRKTHTALAHELLSGRLRLPETIIARHRDKAGQAA